MPRPPKYRCVEFMPPVTYFRPGGVRQQHLEEMRLSIEEVEAIRLKDMEGLDQEECAESMHVSRATLQRILDSARKKLAEALVYGKAIRVQGGNFEVALRRFRCADKGHEWEVKFGARKRIDLACPDCNTTNIYRIDQARFGFSRRQCRRRSKTK